MLSRKVLLLAAGALALYGAQACATDTELNPQPLPPGEPTAVEDPENGDKKGGGSSGSTPPPSSDGASDAGDAGDAADAHDASDSGDAAPE